MDNKKKYSEKIEILKLLIENKEESYSIRKIALIRKINYKSAYNALKALEKEGISELKSAGNTTLCSFNNKFNDLVFRAEYSRRENLLKKKEFRAIYDILKQINKQFIILLFGSHVKGTATKHSDIDFLLISQEADAKKIDDKLSILPFEVHLTPVGYESFVNMLKSKESSVVSEALKKNIILFGIEDYYRLIQNAK